MRSSAGLATALNPYLGYENATMIAREAMRTGRPVPDLVLEHGLMDKAKLDAVLSPDALTKPSHHAK